MCQVFNSRSSELKSKKASYGENRLACVNSSHVLKDASFNRGHTEEILLPGLERVLGMLVSVKGETVHPGEKIT